MDELIAKRWTKNGKDRLYVNRVGVRAPAVAWLDLESGETMINDPDYAAAARRVIADWIRAADRSAAPPLAAAPPPLASSVPPLPPLTKANDLAHNRPGAAVKDKVRELEAEHSAPVRWIARTFGLVVPGTEPWRAGLVGERVVGKALSKLKTPDWHVLHAVPWPSGADVDHLVIGPTGVFTINAKHHAGARVWVGDTSIRVNNRSTDHIRFALAEADRVSKVLYRWCGWAVAVQPVVAIVGAKRITFARGGESGVLVVPGTEVDRRLAEREAGVIPAHRISRLFEVARRREVWLSPGR